jgi:hypothetical protein
VTKGQALIDNEDGLNRRGPREKAILLRHLDLNEKSNGGYVLNENQAAGEAHSATRSQVISLELLDKSDSE